MKITEATLGKNTYWNWKGKDRFSGRRFWEETMKSITYGEETE